jgi:hypothetical protein
MPQAAGLQLAYVPEQRASCSYRGLRMTPQSQSLDVLNAELTGELLSRAVPVEVPGISLGN